MKGSAVFLLVLVCVAAVLPRAQAVHHGGSHKGVHQMPKASLDYHRIVEEPENHPHLKHFYDWRKKADDIGASAKAFRGKIPDDLIHYMVREEGMEVRKAEL